MHINNIYQDSILKYPLTDIEYKLLHKVWEFIELFKFMTITLHEFRKKIIHKINTKYDEKEFFILETILEKLFWNLRWLLYPLFVNKDILNDKYINQLKSDSIPKGLLLTEKFDLNSLNSVIEKMHKDNYYRSFINKIINIDDKNKVIHYKKPEGSIPIFNKNSFNLYTSTIMLNKSLYEKIMHNPFIIKEEKIKLPKVYYEFDYSLPNLNMCCPLMGSERFRKKKIQKMYYESNAEGNWFILHKPDFGDQITN